MSTLLQIATPSQTSRFRQTPLPAARVHDVGHRTLLGGEFWRDIPGYRDIDQRTFLDHGWQSRSSVTGVRKLREAVAGLVPDTFYTALEEGLGRAPMSVRLTPYLVALIDWRSPETDPLRRQFLPLVSELLPDHPLCRPGDTPYPELGLDSLAERKHSPVPGLTHRYPDKALFLALDTCPVYCRYCTRSYAVGGDTESVDKVRISAQNVRWQLAFDYVRSHPEIEDIVVSGGDAYNLKPAHIEAIGYGLLAIEHVRRIRVATKGPAIMPMKLLTDEAWVSAFLGVVHRGRAMGKDVVLHTHFDHPTEATDITQRAAERLFSAGVTMRSQCVLLRGVNDDARTMQMLVKRLGYLNIQAYYVYQHDFVKGVEDLRTTLGECLELEKEVRGATAGFNTPTFVVDLPGGGGKRDAHSFEHYDRVTGISVYRSPNCDRDAHYLYFDPIDRLPEEGRRRWADPSQYRVMIDEALARAQP